MMKRNQSDYMRTELNKTRVENVGFSRRLLSALRKSNIRTVGGILTRSKSELRELLDVSEKDAEELLKAITNIPITPILEQEQKTQSPWKKDGNVRLGTDDEEDIVRTLAESLGLTKKEVVSPSRRQDIVRVRDLIVFLLREYGDMSYPAIGRLLGGRDHTTIIHAHKKILKLAENDSELRHGLSHLIASVQEIKERKLAVEKEIADSILSVGDTVTRRAIPVYKEIPERNLKTLELYREGLTLANIGSEIGVSRERVRQIVATTVRQMAINEAITKDIVMDSDVMLEEESKKRKAAQELKRNKGKKSEVKEKQWSRYYTSCQQCGTTVIPHVRKGLCEQCIGSFRGGRREKIISDHNNQCDSCKKTRAEAAALYGRDLYITKNRKVLCKACFRKFSGKRLGGYKNYEWSRFHPACKSCRTTTIPHASKGFCEKCTGKVTNEERERVISEHGNACDECGINRKESRSTLGRDLYITKVGKVLCRTCFQKHARRGLLSANASKR